MKSTYGKTFCLLAGTTVFTGCLTTPTEQKPMEEVATAPASHAQPTTPEPANVAVGGAVHHGVEALGSEAQFAKVIAHGNVIVDIYSPTCPPCKKLAPELDALAAEFGTKVQFIKVDATRFGALADRYKVQGYPTLLFFKDGMLIHTKVGSATRSSLKDLIVKTFGL